MIIWSSINYPTIICLPTICYFSREKLLVKSTAPSLFFIIFAFEIYFYLLLFFRSINPKTQKYLAAIFIYLFYLAFPRDLFIQSTTNFTYLLLGRDWQPLFTPGCKYLFFVCMYRSRSVAWFSYWFDNFGLITEGNTYCRCAASSLPLWGNADAVLAGIREGGTNLLKERCQSKR